MCAGAFAQREMEPRIWCCLYRTPAASVCYASSIAGEVTSSARLECHTGITDTPRQALIPSKHTACSKRVGGWVGGWVPGAQVRPASCAILRPGAWHAWVRAREPASERASSIEHARTPTPAPAPCSACMQLSARPWSALPAACSLETLVDPWCMVHGLHRGKSRDIHGP